MRIPLIWRLMVFLAFTLESFTFTNEMKVYGGRFAYNGEFPYTVYLERRIRKTNYAICGGILASMNNIISAAHCFLDNNDPHHLCSYKVVGGTIESRKADKGRQERKIIMVKVHEKYRQMFTTIYDIALAQLNVPFKVSDTVSPIKLASEDELKNKEAWEEVVMGGKTCTAVGWGTTGKDSEQRKITSKTLIAVQLKPLTNEQCSQEHLYHDSDMISQGEACLSQISAKEGICYGDSGNPLICNGYVFGLARGGSGCGSPNSQKFILIWPFLKYFHISLANQLGSVLYMLPTTLFFILNVSIF